MSSGPNRSSAQIRVGVLLALAGVASLVAGVMGGCGTNVPAPSVITEAGTATPASASGYATLDRGRHPLARPELDIGSLDPTKRIENLSVVFKLSPVQLHDRDALLADVINPGSPRYHHWLTPEQYAVRFGANRTDIDRTKAWLAQQGLEVNETSRLGARVTFSGTVANLQAAFKTELHRYRVGGETHYAMATPPSIPVELSDVVLGLHGTHDFYPRHVKPSSVRVAPQATCPGGDTHCSGNGLAPPDWAAIYDVNKLYSPGISGTAINGTGVTIGIVGISAIAQTDINAFRTKYGLPASTVTMTLVPNTGAAVGANGASLEAILDTEWSGGIAPKANIVYVYAGANSGNVDDAVYYAIEQNVAPILSESFAGCEAGQTQSDADALGIFGSAANVLGITYLAASGDDSAAACLNYGIPGLYVNMPATFPGVTAVGGTEFPTGTITYSGGTATGYSSQEQVWNESNSATAPVGGGGGISIVFNRPSYQSGIPTCPIVGSLPVSGITPAKMREIPDLSLTAAASNNGYFVECTYNSGAGDCTAAGGSPTVIQVGGTSASTPSFAGVLALVTQATGGGRLGNVNPLLYTLQSTTPSAFHDITLATNEVKCTSGTDPGCGPGNVYGYAAATGYDCATGLGSLDTYNLVSAWAALTPTATAMTANPTSMIEGGSIDLSATVNVTGTNSHVLGGTVTFAFQAYLANGEPDLSWTLVSAPIANGTTSTGSVSETAVAIPPGLVRPGAQGVDVVAMYGGDANHLASTSTKVHITFSTVSFCVTPGATSVAAGAHVAIASQGGAPPYLWRIVSDSTCNSSGTNCSALNESTGAFVAGTGAAGWVLVQALDNDGAETFSEITVGSPTGSPPWAGDSGITSTACQAPSDAGTDAGGGTCANATLFASPGSPQAPGTPVTLTAGSSSCGSAQYEFWELAPGGSWQVVQAYGSSPTFAFSGTTAGTYEFQVWARAAGSSATYETWASLSYAVTGAQTCASATLSASPSSPQVTGTSVTLTSGSSSCGSPQYEFWELAPGGSWQLAQAYSSSPTFPFSSTTAGAYSFQVWVRDASSGAVYDTFAGLSYTLTPALCAGATLSAAPTSPQVTGTPVMLTAGSSSCSSPQYAFYELAPGGSWQLVQAYSSTPTFAFSSSTPGTYAFEVWVRDASSGAAYDTYAALSYTLTPALCSGATLSASPSSPQWTGTAVTLTAGSSSCSNPQYAFYELVPGGSWQVVQAYSSSPTFPFSSTTAGAYDFQVWVRDATSGAAYDAWAGLSYALQ